MSAPREEHSTAADRSDSGGSGSAAPAFNYAIIEAAIRYLETHAERQPSLEELAAHTGYSPSHLQRMFTAWAGVSPKKYLSFLTLDHAKTLLRERRSLLETSLETGLSSPSRLHDLFLSWEAMSPGAYASGGDGLALSYGFLESPFGEALAMGCEKGIAGLAFTAEVGREAALADLAARWPAARLREDPAAVAPLVEAAFGGPLGRRSAPAARLALIGAPFQIKVWEALLAIPSGHVATYSDIAARIGSPKAVRAVGTAIGRNPISWLIPCHRALRKSGELGGYHWGQKLKRAMLAHESAQLESARHEGARSEAAAADA